VTHFSERLVIETSIEGGSPIFEFISPNTLMLGNKDSMNIYTIITALGTPKEPSIPGNMTTDIPGKGPLQDSDGASDSEETSGSANKPRSMHMHSPLAHSSVMRTGSCEFPGVPPYVHREGSLRRPSVTPSDHGPAREGSNLEEQSEALVPAVREVLPKTSKTATWQHFGWVEGTNGQTEQNVGVELVDTPSTGASHSSMQQQARGTGVACRESLVIKTEDEQESETPKFLGCHQAQGQSLEGRGCQMGTAKQPPEWHQCSLRVAARRRGRGNKGRGCQTRAS